LVIDGVGAAAAGAAAARPPWAGVPGVGLTPTSATSVAGFLGPASDVGSSTALTRRIEGIWSSDGGGEGGRPLDQALTNLGQSYIENNRVIWEPPTDLSPTYTDYLSESVAQLNRLIERGLVEIDTDGNIRPTGV
jgi:hypothetical protein